VPPPTANLFHCTVSSRAALPLDDLRAFDYDFARGAAQRHARGPLWGADWLHDLAYSGLRHIAIVSYTGRGALAKCSLQNDLMVTLREAITRGYALGLRLM